MKTFSLRECVINSPLAAFALAITGRRLRPAEGRSCDRRLLPSIEPMTSTQSQPKPSSPKAKARPEQPWLSRFFPLLAILLSVVALLMPALFTPGQGFIVPLLAGIMFMMGLSLQREDLARLLKDPRPVIVGVALQFLLMPILALTLAKLLQLSTQLTFGLVLLGSCAGGTASNVMCFLARGDLALSVSMTMTSTLIGVVATPLLCQFYLAEQIDLNRLAMLQSLIIMVLLPVVAGFICRALLPTLTLLIQPWLPSLSITGILAVIAIVVALNATQLGGVGFFVVVAVVLHNALGIGCGLLLSRLFGFDLRQSQTIAIEVGMQNSGLAAALSLQFFSATAALPAALFSIWHNVSGALLAGYWGKRRDSLAYLLADIKDSQDDGA